MFCTKCGSTLPEGGLFCDNCGTDIDGREESFIEKDIPETEDLSQADIFIGESQETPDFVPAENVKEKKKKKEKKNKKKRPLLRFFVVLLVLFLVFNVAKAAVFVIDYKDYIFVNEDNCGMRDKDELIDKSIEAMLNGDDGECYRLSFLSLTTKEAMSEGLDFELTEFDRIKFLRITVMSVVNISNYITEQLGTEAFETTYAFIDTESVDVDTVKNFLEGTGVDEDDIEKAEEYEIKITCKGNGGKTEVINLTLGLVRISRTWYVYNWDYYYN